jgi:hypothetical protein
MQKRKDAVAAKELLDHVQEEETEATLLAQKEAFKAEVRAYTLDPKP